MSGEASLFFLAVSLIAAKFLLIGLVILVPMAWLVRRVPAFVGWGAPITWKTFFFGFGACLAYFWIAAWLLANVKGTNGLDGSQTFLLGIVLFGLNFVTLRFLLRDETGETISERPLILLSLLAAAYFTTVLS